LAGAVRRAQGSDIVNDWLVGFILGAMVCGAILRAVL
jgi:hypothetical protein